MATWRKYLLEPDHLAVHQPDVRNRVAKKRSTKSYWRVNNPGPIVRLNVNLSETRTNIRVAVSNTMVTDGPMMAGDRVELLEREQRKILGEASLRQLRIEETARLAAIEAELDELCEGPAVKQHLQRMELGLAQHIQKQNQLREELLTILRVKQQH